MDQIDGSQERLRSKNNFQSKDKTFYFLSLVLCVTCTIVKAKIHSFNKVSLSEKLNLSTPQSLSQQHEIVINSQNMINTHGIFYHFSSTDFFFMFTSFQSVTLQILIVAIILKYSQNIVRKQYLVMLVAFLTIYSLIFMALSYSQINGINSFLQLLSSINILPLALISSFGLIPFLPQKLKELQKYIAAMFYFLPNIGVPISDYFFSENISKQQSLFFGGKLFLTKLNIICSITAFLAIIILLQYKTDILNILYQQFGQIERNKDKLKLQTRNNQIYRSFQQSRHHFIGNDIEQIVWLNQMHNPGYNIFISGFVNTKNSLRKFNAFMVMFVILGWGIVVAISKLIPSLEKNLKISSSRILPDSYIYHRQFQQLLMIITLAMVFIWLIRRIQSTYLLILCQIVVFSSYLLIILACNKIISLSSQQITGAVLVGQSFYSSLIILAIYSEKIQMSLSEIIVSLLIANLITQLQSKALILYAPTSALFVLFLLAPIILSVSINYLNSNQTKQIESSQDQN